MKGDKASPDGWKGVNSKTLTVGERTSINMTNSVEAKNTKGG